MPWLCGFGSCTFLTVTLELKCLKAIACTKLHAICNHHLPQYICVVRITEDMTFLAPKWLQKRSLSIKISLEYVFRSPYTLHAYSHEFGHTTSKQCAKALLLALISRKEELRVHLEHMS